MFTTRNGNPRTTKDGKLTVVRPAQANQAPSVPGNLSASNITNTSLTLSWSASTDADGTVGGYEIRLDSSAVVDVGNFITTNITSLNQGTNYGFEVRAYDNEGLRSAWSNVLTSSTTGTAPTSLYESEVASATEVLSIMATDWPVGDISKAAFEAATPFNSGHWKYTNDRFARKTYASISKDLLQFKDPKLVGTKDSTWNPWNRRVAPEIDWGAKYIVSDAGVTPGNYGFTWLELYFPEHTFTGIDNDEGFAASHTIKFLDGWNPGDVGSTGNNPQVLDDSWEAVFTLYWLISLQNNGYSLNSKGDFGIWQDGASTIDVSGVFNPVIDLNDDIQMQKNFFLGVAFYAHDVRQTYNYQNMCYFLWPGTNHRIIVPVDAHIEFRYFIKLNTPSASGPYDGQFYAEMKIHSWPRALPPGINLNTWFAVRNLTDVDYRGTGTSPVLDNGNGFFSGGGLGDAFMDNDDIYDTVPGYPPRYARNFGYQKKNLAK